MSNFTPALHRALLAAGLLAAPIAGAYAQTLYNSGSAMSVTSGATLYVKGTIQQTAGSNLQNAGLVVLDGDLNSTPTGTVTNSPGEFRFTNTQAQQLLAESGATIGKLTENTGTGGLTVPANLNVTTLITTAGLIKTPASAIIDMPTTGSVTGEDNGHYVQGNLRIARATVASSTNFSNSFTLDPQGQTLTNVQVLRTAGLQTANVSYGTPGNPAKKGIDRIWKVTADGNPTSAVTVTTTWLSDNDNGTDATTMQMWRGPAPSGPWTLISPTPTSGRTVTASTNLLSGGTNFTDSDANNPLPVTLLSFEAQRYGDDGQLTWATASEQNSAYFDVESSTDGTTYKAIGRVAAKGNSVSRSDYQLRDKNLLRYGAEHIFYRLHMVDADGSAKYSPVRDLAVPVAGFAVQAFPNPYTQQLSLRLQTTVDGPATVTLYDVTGRQVLSANSVVNKGISQIDLSPDASTLATGVYLLRVTQAGRTSTLRLTHE